MWKIVVAIMKIDNVCNPIDQKIADTNPKITATVIFAIIPVVILFLF